MILSTVIHHPFMLFWHGLIATNCSEQKTIYNSHKLTRCGQYNDASDANLHPYTHPLQVKNANDHWSKSECLLRLKAQWRSFWLISSKYCKLRRHRYHCSPHPTNSISLLKIKRMVNILRHSTHFLSIWFTHFLLFIAARSVSSSSWAPEPFTKRPVIWLTKTPAYSS